MSLPYPLNRIFNLLVPSLTLLAGIAFGSYTFVHILFVERSLRLAFNFRYWRAQQFTRLWKIFGPVAAKSLKPTISPLAEAANGVVLDIGTGDGQNVAYYNNGNITKLYLVEPCIGLHDALRENLKQARLEDIAIIIACGVQDVDILHEHGITPASIDTVVTFSVLCSVPAPEETCRFLYSRLKPGGQWLIAEHVLADQKYPLSRQIQGAFQVVWPTILGGCNINRDTGRYVRDAGPWSQVDLVRGKDEYGWEMLGHVVGRLVR